MTKQELEDWVGWNYLGLIAGVLSVAVTMYNINSYWNQIKGQGGLSGYRRR